jgi:ribonucleoside-diphosphate reductase alpha chain
VAEKYLESGFVKTLPSEVKNLIEKKGMRNVTLTTQAPTGTVGTMLSTSTGIEPYYAFEFYQQSRLGFHKVDIPLAKEYKDDEGNLPDYFVSAMMMGPLDHIKVQAAVQEWTDSSISKTANAPSDFTLEQTKELYEKAYDLGCKGVTIYRDNCRSEQVLSTSADTEKKNEDSAKNIKRTSDSSKENKEQSESQRQAKKETLKESESKPKEEVVYGSEIGDTCPACKKGTMIKIGGCTQCSENCGFTGSCDMK